MDVCNALNINSITINAECRYYGTLKMLVVGILGVNVNLPSVTPPSFCIVWFLNTLLLPWRPIRLGQIVMKKLKVAGALLQATKIWRNPLEKS